MTSLHAPAWAWAAIIAALAVLLCADLLGSRRDRPPRMSESAWWTLATVVLAVAFGLLLTLTAGGTASGQFFAGWLTEYSLSLDNLLVFVILISRSPVPGRLHSRVLLAGIGLAILLRGVVIGLGAAALHRFAWLEYLFGAFLLFTAARVARRGAPGPPASTGDRTAPAQGPPHGPAQGPSGGTGALVARLTRRRGSRPVLMLVIALGITDVMFAVDSIPAVFGLTRDPFLVFSANVFALLGLRHLFFLVAGLLARLIYLRAGLCVILSFIGVKLIGEALRGSGVTRLGPAPVPAVSAWLSLAIIALVLAATALASVVATRRRGARRDLADPAACGEHRLARRSRAAVLPFSMIT